jgi:hypothetical protein
VVHLHSAEQELIEKALLIDRNILSRREEEISAMEWDGLQDLLIFTNLWMRVRRCLVILPKISSSWKGKVL